MICVLTPRLALFLAVVVWISTGSAGTVDLYEGSACKLRDGSRGQCIPFIQCATAVAEFKKDRKNFRPMSCGFRGHTPVICCKDVPLRKSEEACRDFSNEINPSINVYIYKGAMTDPGEFPHMVGNGDQAEPYEPEQSLERPIFRVGNAVGGALSRVSPAGGVSSSPRTPLSRFPPPPTAAQTPSRGEASRSDSQMTSSITPDQPVISTVPFPRPTRQPTNFPKGNPVPAAEDLKVTTFNFGVLPTAEPSSHVSNDPGYRRAPGIVSGFTSDNNRQIDHSNPTTDIDSMNSSPRRNPIGSLVQSPEFSTTTPKPSILETLTRPGKIVIDSIGREVKNAREAISGFAGQIIRRKNRDVSDSVDDDDSSSEEEGSTDIASRTILGDRFQRRKNRHRERHRGSLRSTQSPLPDESTYDYSRIIDPRLRPTNGVSSRQTDQIPINKTGEIHFEQFEDDTTSRPKILYLSKAEAKKRPNIRPFRVVPPKWNVANGRAPDAGAPPPPRLPPGSPGAMAPPAGGGPVGQQPPGSMTSEGGLRPGLDPLDDIVPYLIGGLETLAQEFKHMVALGFRVRGSSTLRWDCGGSLISKNHVLTAAHCVTNSFKGKPVAVRLGAHNLTDMSAQTGGKVVPVQDVIWHPEYSIKAHYNDVAIVKIPTVRFDDRVQPACLYNQPKAPQTGMTATGWGVTDIDQLDQTSDVLMKAGMDEVSLQKCNQSFGRILSSRLFKGVQPEMICARGTNGVADTCLGDSGGPLQITEPTGSVLYSIVGVTSFGQLCGGLGVYVRVSSYLDWIESVVWPDS